MLMFDKFDFSVIIYYSTKRGQLPELPVMFGLDPDILAERN